LYYFILFLFILFYFILFYFIILYFIYYYYFFIISHNFCINTSSNIIFFGKRTNYAILPIQYFTRNKRVAFILKYANKYSNSRYFNAKI